MKLFAKTFSGLEDTLCEELKDLGAENIVPTKRGVSFEGDTYLLYAANYTVRTAVRFLMPLLTFKAENQDELYSGMRQIPWVDLFSVNKTFAIDSIVSSKYFNHSHFVSLKAKDAIADAFREKFNRRPNVENDSPNIRIHIKIHDTDVEVALDSSGDSLHKRGYKQSNSDAPINETLAAGILRLSGWSSDKIMYDAMCGSGTFLTEAAFIATNTPIQKFRDQFCFFHWNNFETNTWQRVRNTFNNAQLALSAEQLNTSGAHSSKLIAGIYGSDIEMKAINACKKNIQYAGFRNITLKKQDFFTLHPETEPGVLVINPPYDDRIKLEDAIDFYKSIGDSLKHNWKGWQAWVFTGNLEAAKFIGLKTSRRIPLFNGPIESRLFKFDLF